nr:DUF4263 domain-containing protein [uncultured Anaerocolumna sp.]
MGKNNKSWTESFYLNEETNEEYLTYRINKEKKIIEFYPKDENGFVDKILLDGFTSLPEGFSNKGYITGSIQYYFNVLLKDYNITKFTISKCNCSTTRKTKDGYSIVISYSEFEEYRKKMNFIKSESQYERRQATSIFLSTFFPELSKNAELSSARKKSRFMQSIDMSVIPELSKDDLVVVQNFMTYLIENRYVSASHRLNLLTSYKANIESVAIDEAINNFEDNLKNDVSEADWGKYLKQYLFLLETKYIKVLTELNLSLATWRKVDFGFIDYQGYLDIFEIKKPSTKIMSNSKDRGNFYWHIDMIKAITQAEKYLFACERKGSDLSEAIKREHNLDVKIIKPKAVLIAGHSDQFDDYPGMEEDFRILRNSLKNVEIILYDELYNRLITLKKRTYEDDAEKDEK